MLKAWPAICCLKSTELIAAAIIATNDSLVNRVPSLSIMFNTKVCGQARCQGHSVQTLWRWVVGQVLGGIPCSFPTKQITPLSSCGQSQMCRVPASVDDSEGFLVHASSPIPQQVPAHKGSAMWLSTPAAPQGRNTITAPRTFQSIHQKCLLNSKPQLHIRSHRKTADKGLVM